jgi:hypothetical protein
MAATQVVEGIGAVPVPRVPTQLFIDGTWRDAADGATFESDARGARRRPARLRAAARGHSACRRRAAPLRRLGGQDRGTLGHAGAVPRHGAPGVHDPRARRRRGRDRSLERADDDRVLEARACARGGQRRRAQARRGRVAVDALVGDAHRGGRLPGRHRQRRHRARRGRRRGARAPSRRRQAELHRQPGGRPRDRRPGRPATSRR